MTHGNIDISEAIIEYHGYGKHKTPECSSDALVELYGREKSMELLGRINKIEDMTEKIARDIDYSNLPQACAELQKMLTKMYGDKLSQKAISAIVWSIAYCVWWK